MSPLVRRHIHIFGASGAGVTTLGRHLANMLAIPHHDTDDFFWMPTDPPYQTIRPEKYRLCLMQDIFLPLPAWILTGSLVGWGDVLLRFFDLVVFLVTSKEIRLQRLKNREILRYNDVLQPATEQSRAFLDWAAAYDEGDETMRSLVSHRRWLQKVEVPLLIFDGNRPPEVMAAEIADYCGISFR